MQVTYTARARVSGTMKLLHRAERSIGVPLELVCTSSRAPRSRAIMRLAIAARRPGPAKGRASAEDLVTCLKLQLEIKVSFAPIAARAVHITPRREPVAAAAFSIRPVA